jgi:hypothetical protein
MIRSFYAVPAMFCLAAALVTAQAPAEDRPAGNAPAAQQPGAPDRAVQQPTTPRPATPTPSAQQPTRPAETFMANKVTYTGCIKPGPTSGTWILENAEVAQRADAAASTPSAVGTSGAAKLSFNLDPAATVNLKPHANHKIEVVGVLSPSARAGAEAAPSSAATTTTATARQQISVDSMKMVSATCP